MLSRIRRFLGGDRGQSMFEMAGYAALVVLAIVFIVGVASAPKGKSVEELTAETSAAMQSWVGATDSVVIAEWGPPTEIQNISGGNRLLIWRTTSSYTSQGSATTNVYGNSAYTTYRAPQTTVREKERVFWVNSEGKVYNWSWKGL